MSAPRISCKTDRIKACELAAQCLQGQCGPETGMGARLMSLIILFETYISSGAAATELSMKILAHDVRGVKRKNWRVIAGGGLGTR